MPPLFQFAIDRGGTFTDIWAKCPNGTIRVLKLLSVDPLNYSDAPREGIRRIIEQVNIFVLHPNPCPCYDGLSPLLQHNTSGDQLSPIHLEINYLPLWCPDQFLEQRLFMLWR